MILFFVTFGLSAVLFVVSLSLKTLLLSLQVALKGAEMAAKKARQFGDDVGLGDEIDAAGGAVSNAVAKTKDVAHKTKVAAQKTVQTAKATGKAAVKTAKTAGKVAKTTYKAAKTTVKVATKLGKLSIKAIKLLIKGLKLLITLIKTIISALISLGWIGIIILIVIVLFLLAAIAGAVLMMYGEQMGLTGVFGSGGAGGFFGSGVMMPATTPTAASVTGWSAVAGESIEFDLEFTSLSSDENTTITVGDKVFVINAGSGTGGGTIVWSGDGTSSSPWTMTRSGQTNDQILQSIADKISSDSGGKVTISGHEFEVSFSGGKLHFKSVETAETVTGIGQGNIEQHVKASSTPPVNPGTGTGPSTPGGVVTPGDTAMLVAKCKEMMNWYLANVHTYANGTDNAIHGVKYYNCPLVPQMYKGVGDECGRFAAAYASYVSGKAIYCGGGTAEMYKGDPGGEAKWPDSGWKLYTVNEIGGAEGLLPGDILVCADYVDKCSKGGHAEVYLGTDAGTGKSQTTGWGKIQSQCPSSPSVTVTTYICSHGDKYVEIGSKRYGRIYRWGG